MRLSQDLGELADLIELVFRDAMDDSGRAAIREMRTMSRLGRGLDVLGRLNDLAVGISLGFVWIADDRLVGNVSVYPADLPASMGKAWIIANVGVHPDYQRQGIARQLMHASMDMIRQRGGTHAILQVDYDNHGAIHLYETLDFVKERAFTTWVRSGMAAAPSLLTEADKLHITRRKRSEWRAEYALAQRIRPNARGGIGWLTPLHQREFAPSWWQRLKDFFTQSGRERLIIRADADDSIVASLWINSSFARHTRLTLLVDPRQHLAHAQALLNTTLRRFRTMGFLIEHPRDDALINDLLKDYRFRERRTVWHMRWDVR